MIKSFIAIALCALMFGCMESAGIAQAETGSMSAHAETVAAPLAESLFKEDTKVISNEDFNKILGADVRVPEASHLAVVRFGQLPYWWGWSENFVRMNQQIDDDF